MVLMVSVYLIHSIKTESLVTYALCSCSVVQVKATLKHGIVGTVLLFYQWTLLRYQRDHVYNVLVHLYDANKLFRYQLRIAAAVAVVIGRVSGPRLQRCESLTRDCSLLLLRFYF